MNKKLVREGLNSGLAFEEAGHEDRTTLEAEDEFIDWSVAGPPTRDAVHDSQVGSIDH